MIESKFADAFQALTGNAPFPWQEALYALFSAGDIPESSNLPTGLGKTSVIPIWLIALANDATKMPRRLVYVVNRRTVVDQATNEAERFRERLLRPGVGARSAHDVAIRQEIANELRKMTASPSDPEYEPIAISTLRGQFADNGAWRADPARPAIVIGTVDMIGSRLLFSGYRLGYKSKPLHAGFLGQDALLVHDEAHLEPAFQKLVESIRCEQLKEPSPMGEGMKLRIMALTATPHGNERPFELTAEEKSVPEHLPDRPSQPIHFVWERLAAKKGIAFHKPVGEKEKVADRIAKLAKEREDSGKAILVYVSTLKDHAIVCKALKGQNVQVLTGTLRGLERDRMANARKETGCPIFARFLKLPKVEVDERERWKIAPAQGTVYLVCTSAGEVGIDISADHLVCDLVAFDRMAQRFGRVNRYGVGDAKVDVVHESGIDENKTKNPNEQARWATLELLKELPQVGERWSSGPLALMQLREREDLRARFEQAYTPLPTIVPLSDILLDFWSLTSVRVRMPGRPPIEPYLHGVENEKSNETYVGWRWEVKLLSGEMLEKHKPQDVLDDYPPKPHELLRDASDRVFENLKTIASREAVTTNPQKGLSAWLVDLDGTVTVHELSKLVTTDNKGKPSVDLVGRIVLLPPAAGGLDNGLLSGNTSYEPGNGGYDVADEWSDDRGNRRRIRVWRDDPGYDSKTDGMRLIRAIDFPALEDEDAEGRSWRWFELPDSGDTDGSETNKRPVSWKVHTDDVTKRAEDFVTRLPLSDALKQAVIVAARLHDLGKKRELWQRSIGNPKPRIWLGKSGGRMKPRIISGYRHEFGTLLDIMDQSQPYAAELRALSDEMQELVLHLIAAHHGLGRPHFPWENASDPNASWSDSSKVAAEVPTRFARLQRRYGRWGLAYVESLLRAADWAASARPSAFVEEVV